MSVNRANSGTSYWWPVSRPMVDFSFHSIFQIIWKVSDFKPVGVQYVQFGDPLKHVKTLLLSLVLKPLVRTGHVNTVHLTAQNNLPFWNRTQHMHPEIIHICLSKSLCFLTQVMTQWLLKTHYNRRHKLSTSLQTRCASYTLLWPIFLKDVVATCSFLSSSEVRPWQAKASLLWRDSDSGCLLCCF